MHTKHWNSRFHWGMRDLATWSLILEWWLSTGIDSSCPCRLAFALHLTTFTLKSPAWIWMMTPPLIKEKCLALFQSTVRKQVGGWEVKTSKNDGVRISVNLLSKQAAKTLAKKKWPKFSENFFKAWEINQMLVTIWMLVRTAGSVVFNSTYTSTQTTQLCPALQPQGLLLTRLLSMGFFRQEYWNGLPFPFPGALLDSGIELFSFTSCISR